ncbi:MAG: T9SS type B sorting domain-containing protein [Flavobacteriaceae bacterium]|nr:T9SS type B sorting domain-containing protein [Flavobacteriaceae bacterium]
MKSTQTTQKCTFIYTTLLLLVVLLFLPLLLNAQTTTAFIQRHETQGINGDLIIIGNTNLGRFKDQPYNGGDVNNESDMVFIDIDGDPSTFNSSSAEFKADVCNKIIYAGLYWGTKIPSDISLPNQVKFKIPGGTYHDLTADVQLDRMYYKDVTDITTGNTNPLGDYFVANINTKEALASENDSNNSAGWALVIVYEDPSEPRKYISTFDGFSRVNGNNPEVDFSYTGFTTPPSGPVEGRIGVVAMEGDLKWTGDQMLFKADANATFTALFDTESPANNFFNSKITIDGAHVMNRNVNSTNTLGWDQKLFDLAALNAGNSLIGNGETGATVRVRTGGDQIFTFLNTFAINIIEPVLQVLTSVEDTSGNQVTLGSPIQLGETVWYNINFQNIGTDNALNTIILNTLPFNVTLDESSIVLPAGVTYTFNSTTRQLRFNIPNSLVLKESDPNNAAYDIRYQVTASNDCFDYTDACTNLLENFIESSYDGETSGQNVSGQPGLNGIDGCGLGNIGSMDLFVDTSSCNFDSVETFCNNNLIIAGHDGYNTYEWVDQNNNPVGNTQTITVTGPGIYTVTQTRIGCSITTRVVTVLGLAYTLTPSDALCKNQADGKVNVEVTDTAATFTYELLQGATIISTVGPTATKNHEFSGLDIGNYSVRVTNNDGCFDIQQFTINEPTLLQATNSVLDNIMPCNGNRLSGRIEINATGGTADYQYSMDGGAFQSENIFETTTEGNHVIIVRDANGCETTTTATIDFDEEIEYNLTKDDVVCLGDSDGTITVNIIQNNAGNTLSYSIDGGNSFQSSPTFTGLPKGDYEITVRKVKGVNTCETIETMTVDQLIFLEFEVSGGFSCESATNQIIATVADQYASDVTYTLDGSTTSTTGIFDDVADGDHTVTVLNTVNGCSADPITVTVEEYTPVSFEVVQQLNSLREYVVNAIDGVPEYEYAMIKTIQGTIPTVEDDDFSSNNVFTINGAGFYAFFVRDAKGCIVEEIIEFKDLEIPNFFTPDGDGINDTWYPRNIELYPNLTVDIFDRYQRLIVSYKGNQSSWDGYYKNKLLPSGDYWYYIRLNEPTDDREIKGNFTLYR